MADATRPLITFDFEDDETEEVLESPFAMALRNVRRRSRHPARSDAGRGELRASVVRWPEPRKE